MNDLKKQAQLFVTNILAKQNRQDMTFVNNRLEAKSSSVLDGSMVGTMAIMIFGFNTSSLHDQISILYMKHYLPFLYGQLKIQSIRLLVENLPRQFLSRCI